MKMTEIRAKAMQHGIKTGKMKKADLIRTIQRIEGNSPCFQSGVGDCVFKAGCCWQEDCQPAMH